MNLNTFINPKRGTTESFEAYRVRRCAANFHVQDMLKGKMFYSQTIPYVKEKSNAN